jgi:hypothetical protein
MLDETIELYGHPVALDEDDLADLRKRVAPGNGDRYGHDREGYGYPIVSAASQTAEQRTSRGIDPTPKGWLDPQAAAVQIARLQELIEAERKVVVARIHELEADLASHRQAAAVQIARLQEEFEAERKVVVARIHELEAALARIRELKVYRAVCTAAAWRALWQRGRDYLKARLRVQPRRRGLGSP